MTRIGRCNIDFWPALDTSKSVSHTNQHLSSSTLSVILYPPISLADRPYYLIGSGSVHCIRDGTSLGGIGLMHTVHCRAHSLSTLTLTGCHAFAREGVSYSPSS
jgi:hypothetical protein